MEYFGEIIRAVQSPLGLAALVILVGVPLIAFLTRDSHNHFKAAFALAIFVGLALLIYAVLNFESSQEHRKAMDVRSTEATPSTAQFGGDKANTINVESSLVDRRTTHSEEDKDRPLSPDREHAELFRPIDEGLVPLSQPCSLYTNIDFSEFTRSVQSGEKTHQYYINVCISPPGWAATLESGKQYDEEKKHSFINVSYPSEKYQGKVYIESQLPSIPIGYPIYITGRILEISEQTHVQHPVTGEWIARKPEILLLGEVTPSRPSIQKLREIVRQEISRLYRTPINLISEATTFDQLPSSPQYQIPSLGDLRFIELIIATEEKAFCSIPDDATFDVHTIGEFVNSITAHCAKTIE